MPLPCRLTHSYRNHSIIHHLPTIHPFSCLQKIKEEAVQPSVDPQAQRIEHNQEKH